MPTQQELDDAAADALALTRFMTEAAGTVNLNSGGADIGTLQATKDEIEATAGVTHYPDVATLLASTATYTVGSIVTTVYESALYEVVDGSVVPHLTTAGGVAMRHLEGPYLILITGQSNAAGANSDGPNPASGLVRVWDGVTDDWGSSDRTAAPLNRANPDGNLGNNNYALGRAHRVAEDTGRPVLVVFEAQGGQALDQWVGTGTASPRYAGLSAKMAGALASPLIVEYGKTMLDEVIVAQGEADFNDGFDVYLGKINTLREQFRAESWCGLATPIYFMSPSDLHDRYQWRDAMKHMCQQTDTRSIFVPTNGLRTEYSQTGSGDFTHFLGESLWEAGYTRIEDAVGGEGTPTFFYGRGTGPADATDETAMTTFRSIVSRDSWTSEVPPNGPGAVGSISWGFQCIADGNYTFALGYDCVSDDLANYGMLAGRQVTATSTADYFAGFGYQVTLEARYTFASGRGHTVADEGGVAHGLFSRYTAAEADPVAFQIGTGTSSSNRQSAFVVRKSGKLEAPGLPVHADDTAATTAGLVSGDIYRTATGEMRVVI